MKIPELNWQNFQIASNTQPELGIPAEYLTAPINRELDRHQGLIRDTDTEKISLDTPIFTFRDGGFTLTGNVRIQARKLLGNVPLIGDTYTPILSKSDRVSNTFQKINQQLNSMRISARVTPDHLWLSAISNSVQKIIEV
jgi:hypothetical protein